MIQTEADGAQYESVRELHRNPFYMRLWDNAGGPLTELKGYLAFARFYKAWIDKEGAVSVLWERAVQLGDQPKSRCPQGDGKKELMRTLLGLINRSADDNLTFVEALHEAALMDLYEARVALVYALRNTEGSFHQVVHNVSNTKGKDTIRVHCCNQMSVWILRPLLEQRHNISFRTQRIFNLTQGKLLTDPSEKLSPSFGPVYVVTKAEDPLIINTEGHSVEEAFCKKLSGFMARCNRDRAFLAEWREAVQLLERLRLPSGGSRNDLYAVTDLLLETNQRRNDDAEFAFAMLKWVVDVKRLHPQLERLIDAWIADPWIMTLLNYTEKTCWRATAELKCVTMGYRGLRGALQDAHRGGRSGLGFPFPIPSFKGRTELMRKELKIKADKGIPDQELRPSKSHSALDALKKSKWPGQEEQQQDTAPERKGSETQPAEQSACGAEAEPAGQVDGISELGDERKDRKGTRRAGAKSKKK
ncbi:unnamed protein product [Vitrella brassicaformis CCMP3155]|uniref:Uncharacterized protein n=1 Tax=Vitrella brassicaformis (strain CCMP3155) TaxID=1169540 RepID=A0A0G4H650_VITBC|nr:unnamed protein product [Vitrella brassicaformis CCMP3155]|eukprot:CEM39338.1 unnamed protein product [Vitrella brassicaformis CCMP3155]